jgi:hypothetical protein
MVRGCKVTLVGPVRTTLRWLRGPEAQHLRTDPTVRRRRPRRAAAPPHPDGATLHDVLQLAFHTHASKKVQATKRLRWQLFL